MAFWRSASSLGASWPWIAPPMQRIAAAAMMPSGVPPMPTSMSVPEVGRHAEIPPPHTHVGDQLRVTRPVEDAHRHVRHGQVLDLGHPADVLADRRGDVNGVDGIGT